jgi:hypothetical protein
MHILFEGCLLQEYPFQQFEIKLFSLVPVSDRDVQFRVSENLQIFSYISILS